VVQFVVVKFDVVLRQGLLFCACARCVLVGLVYLVFWLSHLIRLVLDCVDWADRGLAAVQGRWV